MEAIDEAKKQLTHHEAEVKRLKEVIFVPTEEEKNTEIPKLEQLSKMIVRYLLTCLILSVLILAILVAFGRKDLSIAIAIASVAGFLGSSVRALLSVNERVAFGWHFHKTGHRTPDPGVKKDGSTPSTEMDS